MEEDIFSDSRNNDTTILSLTELFQIVTSGGLID